MGLDLEGFVAKRDVVRLGDGNILEKREIARLPHAAAGVASLHENAAARGKGLQMLESDGTPLQ